MKQHHEKAAHRHSAGRSGTPETFRDRDRITVPEEDAVKLAVNGMAINPEVYITDIAFRDTIGKELEEHGIKVENLDFQVTRGSAGSVHCSTQPLFRVKKTSDLPLNIAAIPF